MKIESILYVDYEATQLDVMLLFVIWANNDNDKDILSLNGCDPATNNNSRYDVPLRIL